jgi:D-lactate dehydrogenase (cytochrome)
VPSFALRARKPQGDARPVRIERDPDVVGAHLQDAGQFPGGHAPAVAAPVSEAQVAESLRQHSAVLPVGAQSSLTGGATPMGDLLLSTSRLNLIESIGSDRVRVQAGVTIAELDRALEAAGRSYPPAPTFAGAFVGGTIATNAAGAATFKYGSTRQWVEGITVVLPTGDVLDIERGATRAHADGYFELHLSDGQVRVPVPRYRMPEVAKLSAGYFAAPEMDLIDLFIGSEGTLGVVTAATLRILPVRSPTCLAFVPLATRTAALDLVRGLRDSAKQAWHTGNKRGVDVRAIEHVDRRCLALIAEDGIDRANGITVPDGSEMALLVALELAEGTRGEHVFDEIGRARDPKPPDTPLVRFCTMVAAAGAFDEVAIAVPGDRARAAQLVAVREAVPAAVNQRVSLAKQNVDRRIEKTAADMIAPFDRLEDLLALYDREFSRRGLDVAVWGHISDGNVHPNVIPRSYADVEAGRDAILNCGREVLRLGGAPLAEHGVGRNPVKQELLRMMYGDDGIEDMRRVKRAIDPHGKLGRGVIFRLQASGQGN